MSKMRIRPGLVRGLNIVARCAAALSLALVLQPVAGARTLGEIQASGVLRICVAGSSAGFYAVNGESFARTLDLKPEVTVLKAWDEQFQNAQGVVEKENRYVARLLADGTCDVFPNDLHVLDWRSSKMDLVAFYTSRKVVVVNRDRKELLTQDDLKGRTAAVQKGTAYDTWLQEQNTTRFAASPVRILYMPTAEAMSAVSAGTADFTVVGAESSFKWVRGDLEKLDIRFSVDKPVRVAWGIHPGADGLRGKLEKYFRESERVGSELDRAWQKQYGISLMEYQLFDASVQGQEFDIRRLLNWIVPAGAALLGIIAAILLWNRRLQREIAGRLQVEEQNRRILELMERREARNADIADFLMSLQRVDSYGEFSRTVFSWLAPVLKVGQASMYLADNEAGVLQLCGSYARPQAQQLPARIAYGEGLPGQCALEKRMLLIDNPDPAYLTIETSLSAATPRTIALVPVLSSGQLLGLMELAFMDAVGEEEQALLERLMPMLALCMEVLQRNQRATPGCPLP